MSTLGLAVLLIMWVVIGVASFSIVYEWLQDRLDAHRLKILSRCHTCELCLLWGSLWNARKR